MAKPVDPTSRRTTPASVLKTIEALDDDFDLFWGRKSPPTKAQIDAAEKALGAKLRDDHRALIRTIGAGAVLAKESVWPRAKEFDVRPMWQFLIGVEIFGVPSSGDAPVIEVVTQSRERAPAAKGKHVAAMKQIGSRRCIGYDAKGRLFEWAPGEAPESIGADGLLDVLAGWLDTLVADKNRMKAEAAAKPRKPKKSVGGDLDAVVDGWLARLEADTRGVVSAELRKAPADVRRHLADRLLALTAEKKPDGDMIYRLPDLTDDPRVLARLFALAAHANAEIREIAVSMIDCLDERPAEAVPVLLQALVDKVEDVRNEAARALATYAPPAAVEPLKAALARQKRRKTWVHDVLTGNLILALGRCGAGRDDVVDLLVGDLSLDDRYASRHAYEALGAMAKKARRAIPALEAIASGKDAYREMHARHALATITGDAKPQLARLQAGTKSKDVAVKASAELALAALQGKRVGRRGSLINMYERRLTTETRRHGGEYDRRPGGWIA